MYYLFKTKRINKPSEYWNMNLGDRIVLKAFIEEELKEKYMKQEDMERKEIPVFIVDVI
ncbi:hypothetical protein [Gottschalkia purinilytica]|uniref:hypothetical protein n=1 Tax=Gottschalkia purinilytica TaxID=1503 RepID=UPI0012FF41BA|nr:hypothetical protein [Gottschalkia purinilytica]